MGASCAEVTAAIEAQLGQVMFKEETSDFFALDQAQQAKVKDIQTTFSEW